MRLLRRMWLMVALLMGLTVLLVAAYEWGPQKELRVAPDGVGSFTTVDDRSAGGTSVARLEEGDAMACDLSLDYRWPYCELLITLTPPEKGIDLSGYEALRVKLQAQGAADLPWRIYLRNYHPAYSRPTDPVSHKVNAILLDLQAYPGEVEIPLTLFTPATWWLTDYEIPLMQQGRDISRVFAIEIATGSGAPAGRYHLKVESLSFHGPWLPASTFYRSLMLFWFLSLLAMLVLDYSGMRQRLARVSERERLSRQRNRELEQFYRLASDEARYDRLTGAVSRSEGERLLTEWQEGVLIFIDIDHFKRINDSRGHAVGDEVLKSLVSELTYCLEEGSTLCRWGGEEFVVLAPARPLFWGVALAEQMRKTLSSSSLWPDGLRVTASFGVAEGRPGEPVEELLRRADLALYQAKNKGRNRVVADPR
ncbi:GGDEF domain-containing protein [Aeromonas diversa]|uniref:GGDEF domain-containing protein n=1 Tax=Aeromonas diversa TaxID=502790 RepID=UPI0039A32247